MTDHCDGCKREVDLTPMLMHGLATTPDAMPVDFVCESCGKLLGQSARCSGCGLICTVNLAHDATNSLGCVHCGVRLSTAGGVLREL